MDSVCVYDRIRSYKLSSVELILVHVLPHKSGILVVQIIIIMLYFRMTVICVSLGERALVSVTL